MKRLTQLVCLTAAAFAIAGCDGDGTQPLPLSPPTDPVRIVGPTTTVSVVCPPKLQVGQTAQCLAYGRDAYGYFTTNTAYWYTTDSNFTVSSTGAVTPSYTGSGTGLVVAVINGQSASTSFTIDPAYGVGATSTVSVACPPKFETGQTAQCLAYGRDSNGYFTTNTAYWYTTDNNFTVSSTGAVTTSYSGSGLVVAVINNQSASTGFTINTATTAALSASIGGQSSIKPNTSCWFWADVSGGRTPYSYSWSQNKGSGYPVNGGADYYAQASSSTLTLTLNVTDADGRTATATKNVSISSGAMICPI